MAAQSWLSSMDNDACAQVIECIERIRYSVCPSEFGYKIQALAAHVMLRMGYTIIAINQRGHPDLVANRYGNDFRFEVEAQAGRPKLRQLQEADFASLVGVPNVIGYYGLAISFPRPYWVIVPATKLIGRPPGPNILMEALSDTGLSEEWTRTYVELLRDRCRLIRLASFSDLRRLALEGRGL